MSGMIEQDISIDKLIKEYDKRIKLGGDDPKPEDMQYRPGRRYCVMRAKKVKNKHTMQRATVAFLRHYKAMLDRMENMRKTGIIKHRHDIDIVNYIERGVF